MRTYGIAQGISALQEPKCKGNKKKRDICKHIADSLCCAEETMFTTV